MSLPPQRALPAVMRAAHAAGLGRCAAGRRARRPADAAIRPHRLVVAAVAVHRRACAPRVASPRCGALPRSAGVRHRVAGGRRVVAVHQHAPLRRPAGVAGRAGGAGAGAGAVDLPGARRWPRSARWRDGNVLARHGLLQRRVAAGRAGAHVAVHRLSVAGLRAMRRSTGRWRCWRRGSACYGIGAMLAAMAALWSQAGIAPWRRLRASVAALALAACGAGRRRTAGPAATLSVTLLQSNVPQDEKFADRAAAATRWRWRWRQMWLAARGQLVIAPETAVPLLPSQLDDLPPGYWRRCAERFSTREQRGADRHAAGRLRPRLHQLGGRADGRLQRRPRTATTSTIWCRSANSFPPGFRWFTDVDEHPAGRLQARRARAAVVRCRRASASRPTSATKTCSAKNWRCALPTRPARRRSSSTSATSAGSATPSRSTSTCNISRMRTLEFQRPMLRATNTGATAIIDHRGQVSRQPARRSRAACWRARCRAAAGITPYAWWASRVGLWPYLALGLLACRGACCAGARPADGRLTAVAAQTSVSASPSGLRHAHP